MLLEANNIVVSFHKENQQTIFGKERQIVLHGLSFEIGSGECVAVVGESGSGKSTLGRVLSGLLKPDSGAVLVEGNSLYQNKKQKSRDNSHAISIVFQDYTTSVNPRFRIKDVISESLQVYQHASSKSLDDIDNRINELLAQVGLPIEFRDRYPHELSGGQLQRVCIARAVAIQPKIIILDEAVSSLDASTQTQIMDLLKKLRSEYNFSYLFITHDLASVTYFCDRILFIYKGEIVERVDQMDQLAHVKNEYAKKLLRSVIQIDPLLK